MKDNRSFSRIFHKTEGFEVITENLIQIQKTVNTLLEKHRYETQRDFQLIAVTKNHSVEAMREAIDNGVTVIGENRVQEAMQKSTILERPVKWHLIGHLQTNKVKQAVALFDLIHSVDSKKLAAEIDRVAGMQDKLQEILLQINLSREESKFGIYYEELTDALSFIATLKNVRLCGLMTIAPHFSDPEEVRPIFKKMYEIFTGLQEQRLDYADIKWLSMGMSNDYKIAIEEGANMVRIGTGIFGQRQY